MTPDEFRADGHQLIDWIADYRATVADAPRDGRDRAGRGQGRAPGRAARRRPSRSTRSLADLDAVLVPGLTHWQHPRFFGYFPSNASLPSVLGDLLSTGLGVLGLSWQASPALTELEEVVADWVRQMVGLSDAWSGVIQDTASTGTLIALLCARERTTGLLARPRRACRPRRGR